MPNVHKQKNKSMHDPKQYIVCQRSEVKPCIALLPVFGDGVGEAAGACCGGRAVGWGVPWVQAPVSARRTFPSAGLAVVFVATWRREEAALIKRHPSHYSPSPPFPSPRSLKKKKSLSKYGGAHGER